MLKYGTYLSTFLSYFFYSLISIPSGLGAGRDEESRSEFARLFTTIKHPKLTSVIFIPNTIFFPNFASCATGIFRESRLSMNGQFPYPVNKFCVFANPALYFGSNPGYRETPFRLYRISLASIFVVFMHMIRPVP